MTSARVRRVLLAGAGLTGAGAGLYLGLVTGRLAPDLDVGRRVRQLGPLTVDIAAAREVVYSVATGPYAVRRPSAMRDKVEILVREDRMLLAAHRTPVGRHLTAVTVETVTFDPPHRIGFHLVRGPVPWVTETFELTETDGGSRLTYTGELGTDLWRLGEAWGDRVAPAWVAVVADSLETIRTESERRAG